MYKFIVEKFTLHEPFFYLCIRKKERAEDEDEEEFEGGGVETRLGVCVFSLEYV